MKKLIVFDLDGTLSESKVAFGMADSRIGVARLDLPHSLDWL